MAPMQSVINKACTEFWRYDAGSSVNDRFIDSTAGNLMWFFKIYNTTASEMFYSDRWFNQVVIECNSATEIY